jgi:hypothetical protein
MIHLERFPLTWVNPASRIIKQTEIVIGLRLGRAFAGLVALLAVHALAALPSFAQMEAQGAKIGVVRVAPQNIFDLQDTRENGALFQLANLLHIQTRNNVVEGLLLFHSGEPLSARLIDETERIIRTKRYFYDVDIRPAAYHDGVVDIDVITRDTWTLDLTGKVSRSGGSNSTAFGFSDDNLLGTATRLGYEQVSDPDRHGWLAQIAYPRAFDGWTEFSYQHGHFNDGSRKIATILRPFYALDTRWAAGAEGIDDDRIESIYNAGDIVQQYRHHTKSAEAFGGWSRGLVNGFTQRYSLGFTAQDDTYALAPDETPPAPFPIDHKVRGPFVRYEVIQDKFVKTRNRDQIARTEIVNMGLHLNVQVTGSSESLGASRDAWLYGAVLSDGYTFPWGHDLHGTFTADRRLASTGEPLSHQGALFRYYGPQTTHAAFYGLVSYDRTGTATAPDQLQIGGDTGLRGYPLRYQEGERRALLTLEERAYSDWYPFRLARVGGAVFYDLGRAWGGVNQNVQNGGWLSDAGIGLRIAVDRAAFANVLHVDLAVPLARTPEIKAVQFLVKTQLTF